MDFKHLFASLVSKFLETDGLRTIVQYDIVGVRHTGPERCSHTSVPTTGQGGLPCTHQLRGGSFLEVLYLVRGCLHSTNTP